MPFYKEDFIKITVDKTHMRKILFHSPGGWNLKNIAFCDFFCWMPRLGKLVTKHWRTKIWSSNALFSAKLLLTHLETASIVSKRCLIHLQTDNALLMQKKVGRRCRPPGAINWIRRPWAGVLKILPEGGQFTLSRGSAHSAWPVHFLQKSEVVFWINFWLAFLSVLGPEMSPKSSQNCLKILLYRRFIPTSDFISLWLMKNMPPNLEN